MTDGFILYPVGRVKHRGEKIRIEIDDDYTEALSGLDQFSHIHVLYWFHHNDSPEKRRTLKVHPRGNPKNPLTGVFATHSPVRPNLIAMTVCKILSVHDNFIYIEEIDALDGSPVIDIKGYLPGSLPAADLKLPEWL